MISLAALGSPYTQNFNTLSTAGTSAFVLDGWLASETGTNANANYTAGTGSGNAGDTYSFGSTGSNDRALGGLQSGTLIPSWGAEFVNNTGSTVTSLTLAYVGEQWRLGATGRADRIDFQFSLNATSLTTGTWTDVNALDFASPVTTTPTGALDGNAAANRSLVNGSIGSLTLANGGSLWIRWTDFNPSGSDDGLAIDDFSITPSGAPGAPTVNLSVSSNAGSESGATVITVTATASAAVVGDQTVNLGVSGSGIDTGDYALSNTVISIPAGATSGSVTFTIADDAVIEGTETATLTISSTSAGIVPGATNSQAIVITDNDAPPEVQLSVSANVARESAATTITVTATAAAPVVGNQTLTLSASGAGISTNDYLLSNATLTIAAGQTTGSATFTVTDDANFESTETAVLTLSNPSAGVSLGLTTSQNVVISNNDGSFLTKVGAATSSTASEIPAFDPASDRLYVVAGSIVNVYSVGASGALTAAGSVNPGFTAPTGTTAAPNSVAIKDGLVAVAYEIKDSSTNAHQAGRVSFFNAADGSFIHSVAVGALPDMLTFTPDGKKILVANEGEPNSYGQANSVDPEGSISVIDLSSGVLAATVQNAGFDAFNADIASLKASGVRIFGPGATVAQDLEPEYITVLPDGAMAIVTLQENNAVAVLDIASATVIAVLPLGTKDFSLPGNGFDASDRDLSGSTGRVNIQNWPVVGLTQPDAITNFTVAGQLYYITANEGDSRAYTGFSEEILVGAAGYNLDDAIFPNEATLKLNANLGRLQLTSASGDTDGDGDFDRIEAFGTRSFTIRDAAGVIVFDSGDQLEQITATRVPTLFNSNGSAASFDTRSDNKGPEPEGVVVGVIGGRSYAFVGLERVGDVIVYDVSLPSVPRFVQYINLPEDTGVEGLTFVAAADSPTGKPLLITANETSNTVAVFEIAPPARIADIQAATHISPFNGQAVREVQGIVTAKASNGFYIQDPFPDNNAATSEGIFVFTGAGSALLSARSVGEAVQVSGTVQEFRPTGTGSADNLTITEIVNNAAVLPLSVAAWIGAPNSVIAAIVLGTDRVVPNQIITDDFVSGGNVETGGDFDPSTEGIDFWESLEGMLVRVNAPVAVSPTISIGTSEELYVLANDGAGASGRTARGGIAVSADDFNPERLQLDDIDNTLVIPMVDVGAKLSDVIGVIDYNANNYELRINASPTVVQASPLQREVSDLAGGTDRLRVATFNVENLDPNDGAAKFGALASAIVTNLRAPDIINLEEVQDNNGAANNGVVDASATLQTLVNAIVAAGGPVYQWRQLDPVNNQDGGEPGGNIRVVFLFDPARVSFVESSLQRLTDSDLSNGDAFANSRKPLVGSFTFNGETVTLIGNHFNSKGGDDPLFGITQPPVLSSEVQRTQQATIVKNYVQQLQAADAEAKVLVLGDLNDFEFSGPLTVLESAGLTSLVETLPASERYSYNFQGNAQTLDHIQANTKLLAALDGYDVVHINSEFAVQVSDHDPVVAQFLIERDGQVLLGTRGRDTLVGTAGTDTIIGGPGRDVLTGGASADRFVYTSVLDAIDSITDFTRGSDRLVIDALLASVGYAGSSPVAAGYLGVLAGASSTTVLFDADGSAGAGLPRPLVELVGVVINDPAVLLDPSLFGA